MVFRKFFWMVFVGLSVVVVSSSRGNELLATIAAAERMIADKYGDSELAQKTARKRLESIIGDDSLSDEDKVSRIRNEFLQWDELNDANIHQLVVARPLTWRPHSLRIVREVDTKTETVVSAESLAHAENNQRNKQERTRSETEIETATKGFEYSAGGSAEAGGSISLNPFSWCAKAGMELKASASRSGGESTRNELSEQALWSGQDQQALERQYSEVCKSVTTVNAGQLRFDFAIRFVNHEDFDLHVRPDSSVPVYCGGRLSLEAGLVQNAKEFSIPAHGEIDLTFRGVLSDTGALEIIDYMRHAAPEILPERGKFTITRDREGRVRYDFWTKIPTTSISCLGFTWNVRRTWGDQDVTLRQALRGINAVYRKPPFRFGADGCLESVLDIQPGTETLDPVIVLVHGDTAKPLDECGSDLDRPLGDEDIVIEIMAWPTISASAPAHRIYVDKLKGWAEQGNADGQFMLGVCYLDGMGVEENAEEAVKWFRKSAEQGNADGQLMLGVCYLGGIGVDKVLSNRFEEAYAQVTPEKVEEAYKQHEDYFRIPERREAALILAAVPADAGEEAKAAARAKIEDVKTALKEGGDFEALAMDVSDDASRDHKGHVGMVGRSAVEPALADALFALEEGQVSDVVESTKGYVLWKALGPVEPARVLELTDGVRNEIRLLLMREAQRRVVAQYIAELRDKATIQLVGPLAP